MGLHSDKTKAPKIIDRTVPEIFRCASKASRLDIIDLFWMLKETGVELIEIDSDILKKVEKLPSGIDFILRIAPEDEFDTCVKHNIKCCIMKENMLSEACLVTKLACAGKYITVEFEINSLDELYNMVELKKLEAINLIQNIRITGLSNFISSSWVDGVELLKKVLRKGFDICPVNRYYIGTAAAVEAVINGMDFVTASFAGYGGQYGYAALEEVLVSIKVLLKSDIKMNLRILPDISRLFKKLTGVKMPDTKPVIGKNIFKYESGIHADAIEKNPSTYEPFEPDIVGQKRQMIIGKHSGTRSITKKLVELGVNCSREEAASILEAVRDESIKLGRALYDDEIRKIAGEVAAY